MLFSSQFQVLATTDGDECPSEEFLYNGEATTEATRIGLLEILQYVSENGLSNASAWVHEVNKEHGIYEFSKGKLRLFFFKGNNGQIAVCTTGVRKSQQKVDKASVNKAIAYKNKYLEATTNNTIELINDDEN